ncbi:hypothetical protein K438DRAFT_1849197 [Mycena galopus ATCC 62051]|nr:hypothetical protein K438DRAFT_1849197 [Mycena galopus ATCC 62051]
MSRADRRGASCAALCAAGDGELGVGHKRWQWGRTSLWTRKEGIARDEALGDALRPASGVLPVSRCLTRPLLVYVLGASSATIFYWVTGHLSIYAWSFSAVVH